MKLKNIARKIKHGVPKLVVDILYSDTKYENSNFNSSRKFEFVDLPVWVLWIDKNESKVNIVSKCHDSFKEYIKDRPIIFLNENNYKDYVELPIFIVEKLETKKISIAQFSDILRLYLLDTYGGTWIDSTVLLTDSIPKEITESDFFCFRVPYGSFFYNFHLSSSWFLHSKPECQIIHLAKLNITKYWKQNNFLINYFLLHIIIKSLYDKSNLIKNIVSSGIYRDNVAPHALQRIMYEDFDSELYRSIIKESFCHKLTYKFNNIPSNSFLEKILGKLK